MITEGLQFDIDQPYTTFAAGEVPGNNWTVGAAANDWITGFNGVQGTGALCHSADGLTNYRCTDDAFVAVLNDNI